MSNRLRISLVIPAYNEESHLEDCLRSAQAQTYAFAEIIVIDNGSSDDTREIANRFKGVRLISEPCQGIVFARNRGFNSARGDIIARIDADTTLPPNWADHVARFYRDETNQTTAWTSGGHFDDVPFSKLASWAYWVIAFRINRWLAGYPTVWGSSMAVPRSLWQKIAGEVCLRTDIHEDLDLTTHLHTAGASIYVDASMTVDAKLRRVWNGRRALWDYLQWWPRTLRVHGQGSWVICWVIGVVPLYVATSLFPLSDTVLRLLGQSLVKNPSTS